jgi:hypothetical protein
VTQLDTQPMIWRLVRRTATGDEPVDLVMHIRAVDEDGTWRGEVRFDGYPGKHTTFTVSACDWVQAHQMTLLWTQIFLRNFAREGPLYWRGTDLPFEIPAWRASRPRLRDRLRAWWTLRRSFSGT